MDIAVLESILSILDTFFSFAGIAIVISSISLVVITLICQCFGGFWEWLRDEGPK